MQHLILKASTTVTDTELGLFEAIASAWEADREGDTITRSAFGATITAWQESNKRLPLLFEHSTTEVGSIDPGSMRPTDAGLIVSGEVDRSTDEGQQVWRSIKSGTCGFSIGYMGKSRSRGNGREWFEIDLLEVSATSRPMHPQTRALSWKSAGPSEEVDEFASLDAVFALAASRPVKSAPKPPLKVETFKC